MGNDYQVPNVFNKGYKMKIKNKYTLVNIRVLLDYIMSDKINELRVKLLSAMDNETEGMLDDRELILATSRVLSDIANSPKDELTDKILYMFWENSRLALLEVGALPHGTK